MVNRDTLFERLRMIDNQSRRIQTSDEEVLQQFVRQLEALGLTEAATEISQRSGPYLVVTNELLNPNFTDDLTSWTEVVDSGITGTTARSIAQSKTLYASMASLKVDMTASTGTGDLKRTQTLTAAVSDSWSFEAWVKVTALTNCKAFVRVEWLDSGSSVLQTDVKEFTATSSIFERTHTGFPYTFPITFSGDIEGLTAPASTTQVKVSVGLEATSSGGVGTVYVDLVRAEKQSLISDRAQRAIVGEFTA
jgi:hypothetical protein